MDERARRLWAAVEARALGREGISQVAEATRLSRATIWAGLQELAHPVPATGPNGRREWHPQGQPEEVNVHDFPSEALGKVIPYGVYDAATNTGWVSVGVDHDTAEFAVETVRRWWRHMGRSRT